MEGKEIGRGQFGAVYQGVLFGSDVAVKKLLKLTDAEADTKYMKREQELLRQLAHPNIVQFIGLCAHDGFLWLISEYVANGCLSKLLYSNEPLSWSRRVHFALDAMQAIAFIHSKNLMHRDLKGENLLLDKSDKVKVCDFGFARKVDKKLDKLSGKKASQLTIAGTDQWMAPEVIVGTPYGQPADVFSFGVTLTEMILRRKPEERHPRNAFDFEVEEFKQALPEDCPPEFSALVIECCKYEPSQRPEAKVMVRGLKELHRVVAEREKTAAAPTKSASAPLPTRSFESPLVTAVAIPAPAPLTAVVTPTPAVAVSSADGAPMQRSPRRAAIGMGAGPYVGLVATPEDEAAASAAVNENAVFRGLTFGSGASIKEARLRWILFQDASPNQHEGWLKVAFGDSSKSAKYFCVLVNDVLYYFKNNKKGEKNVGRLILDSQLDVSLQDKNKKHEIVLINALKQTLRLLGTLDELKQWSAALLAARSTVLDVLGGLKPTSPAGLTALTRDPDVLSFPVRFGASTATLLFCVSKEGVKILQAFLEDVLLDIPWSMIVKWQISRNDVIELYVVAPGSKKPVVMEFACLAWASASKVFETIEVLSKESASPLPAALKTPLSPRLSVGDPKSKRASGRGF